MAFDNELNGDLCVTDTAQSDPAEHGQRREAKSRKLELVDEQLMEWREIMKKVRENTSHA